MGIFEKIQILIESVFDSKGFIEARTQAELLEKTAKTLNIPFSNAADALKAVGKEMGGLSSVSYKELARYKPEDFMDFGVSEQTAHAASVEIARIVNLMRMLRIGMAPTADAGWQLADAFTGAGITGKDAFERLARATMRFKMYLLSVMYFGWQLKRTFWDFLQTATEGYMKLTQAQTPAGKAMLKMQAAWEFFKFALIDALSPLIIWFTELITKTLDWISLHPEAMKWIGILIAIAGAVGIVLYWLGTVGLGIQGLSLMFKVFGVSTPKDIKKITTALSGIGETIWNWLPWIIIAFAVIVSAWQQSHDWMVIAQNKALAKAEERWNDYYDYALMESIEGTSMIEKTFWQLLYNIGDIFNSIMGLWSDLVWNFIGSIPTMLAGWAKVIPGIDKIFASWDTWIEKMKASGSKFWAQQGANAVKGFEKTISGIEGGAAVKAIVAGIPIDKIKAVYGDTTEVIDKLWEAVQDGVITQEQYSAYIKATGVISRDTGKKIGEVAGAAYDFSNVLKTTTTTGIDNIKNVGTTADNTSTSLKNLGLGSWSDIKSGAMSFASEFSSTNKNMLDTMGTDWNDFNTTTKLGSTNLTTGMSIDWNNFNTDAQTDVTGLETTVNEKFNSVYNTGTTKFAELEKSYKTNTENMIASTTTMVNAIISQLNKIPREIVTVHRVVTENVTPLTGVIGAVAGAIGAVGKVLLGTRQFGGPINETGAYLLHKGEYVQTKGQTGNISYNPVYNISGVSDVNALRRLIDEHDRKIMSQIQRMKIPGV